MIWPGTWSDRRGEQLQLLYDDEGFYEDEPWSDWGDWDIGEPFDLGEGEY